MKKQGKRARKLTVEECLALDIAELTQKGVFEAKGIQELILTGFCAPTPSKMLFFVERLGEDAERIFFRFRVRNVPFEVENEVRYAIEVISEPCRFGGKRRYFRCPLVFGSNACRKRVQKLFLPPGGRYFGCRTCYGLTYESVQQHDQRVHDLSRKDWPELARLLKLPFRQRLLVHDAICKKQVRFFKLWRSSSRWNGHLGLCRVPKLRTNGDLIDKNR
jgi:hypothetical protein